MGIKETRALKGLPEYCRVDADIDYRFTTSFGLAELPTPHRHSRKHLEISRILHSLTRSRLPIISLKDTGMQGGPSPSKNMHEATIQRCVEG